MQKGWPYIRETSVLFFFNHIQLYYCKIWVALAKKYCYRERKKTACPWKKASNVLLTVKPGIKVEGTDNYVFLQNIQVFELNWSECRKYYKRIRSLLPSYPIQVNNLTEFMTSQFDWTKQINEYEILPWPFVLGYLGLAMPVLLPQLPDEIQNQQSHNLKYIITWPC